MASVNFSSVGLSYPGHTRPAVSNLNLDVTDGEFMILVGPSGCGKSTTLRMLAGLEDVSQGTITIDGKDVTNIEPKDRDIAMVFQSYALYPHMTVAQNMEFALKMEGIGAKERLYRVSEAAEILDLTEYLNRKPKALSGGQRQRVAMGRAIVRKPKVFLMDEPLSNLDAKLRVSTRTQIAELQKRLGITTVYVTHDQVEAMTMGDRVAVLKDGQLQQVDTPLALYEKPLNMFVAQFIGSPGMNIIKVDITDGCAIFGSQLINIQGFAKHSSVNELFMGVRPENLTVSDVGSGVSVRVKMVEQLGADAFIYGNLSESSITTDEVTIRVDPKTAIRAGDSIHIAASPSSVCFFDVDTGNRHS